MGEGSMDNQGAARVGRWIRRAREQRGMRQQDLINASGVSQSTLSLLENGKSTNASLKTFQAIEDGLNVPHGTLRQVAAGADVPTSPNVELPADELLVATVRKLRDELAFLRDAFRVLDERVDDLERRQDPGLR